ncbi:MAG TPA: hypothetical protein ENK66_09030 [Arcobacter sp.]|nr:hypothetical protein [Arcobacter sp.]
MKLINYIKIVFFLSFFLLVGCSATETNSRSNYSDLNFIDLVRNKEDSIHNQRVNTLNSKISNREEDIKSYQKKIRLTKQAINNVKIEVSSYNSMINNVTDRISNVNQLNTVLNQFEQQIRNVELEFDRVKNISEGLEKITKSEFIRLKRKGYFSDLNWLDYAEMVQEVIEYKQEVDRQIKNQKSYIKYAQRNPTKVLGRVLKWGAKKALRRLIPPLAIYDTLETIWSIGKSIVRGIFS